jgi:hypothetical protein
MLVSVVPKGTEDNTAVVAESAFEIYNVPSPLRRIGVVAR